jgi:transcriptional regulator with GAF, ATPase, and Fis domain
VLDHCNWKLEGAQGAAEILGLKPSTLRSRMQKLEIARK